MRYVQTFVDKTFKDNQGRVVLGQFPNLSLMSFVLFSITTRFFRSGSAGSFCKVMAFGSLFVWSWLEITSGVNYFRRALGLGVMIVNVASAITYLQSFS